MRPLLLLCLLLVPPAAAAQTVYRCVAADGSSLFADRPCRFLDADPAAPPEPMIDDAPAGLDRHGVAPAPLALPDAANGCPAANARMLRWRVADALAQRDINSLAGLYDWAGAGRREARRVLTELQALIDARPGELRLEQPAWAWNALPQHRPLPRLALYRDASAPYPQASYRLVENAGCVWLGG